MRRALLTITAGITLLLGGLLGVQPVAAQECSQTCRGDECCSTSCYYEEVAYEICGFEEWGGPIYCPVVYRIWTTCGDYTGGRCASDTPQWVETGRDVVGASSYEPAPGWCRYALHWEITEMQVNRCAPPGERYRCEYEWRQREVPPGEDPVWYCCRTFAHLRPCGGRDCR